MMALINCTVTFSASLVQKFWEAKAAGTYNGQRLGQAVYNHFNLHKVVSEKEALDYLYNETNEQAVRAWLANHTDLEN